MAHEFCYQTARGRVFSRAVDPNTFLPLAGAQDWVDPLPADFADVPGLPRLPAAGPGMLGSGLTFPQADEPWTDFAATPDPNAHTFSIERKMRYLSAQGIEAQQALDPNGAVSSTDYLHGDLTASGLLSTDAGGAKSAAPVNTAFGEQISGSLPSRYQYDGGWGYESGLVMLAGANSNIPNMTLQHVGARWYDVGLGRFVQRDPLSLRGGANVYTYLYNHPAAAVDPVGLGVSPMLDLIDDAIAAMDIYEANINAMLAIDAVELAIPMVAAYNRRDAWKNFLIDCLLETLEE